MMGVYKWNLMEDLVKVCNGTHSVLDKKRGCVSSHYWTGKRSLEDGRGHADLCESTFQQISTECASLG